MNTTEFVKTYGIEAKLTQIPDNPYMRDKGMINYSVTLHYLSKTLNTYFSTGVGWIEDLKGNPVSNYQFDIATKKIVPDNLFSRKTITMYDVDQATRTHRIRKPSADDILDCLASDASGIENSDDFESWADEYGYSRDSRSAEEIYHVCKRQARELESFLGRELYNTLLWEVERL